MEDLEHLRWCGRMIESAPDYFARIDLLGRFVFANRALCDALGIPREELVGQGPELLQTIAAPEDLGSMLESIQRVVETRQVDTIVVRFRRHDGWRCLEHTLSPDLSERGELRGMNIFVRDITDIRQAQESQARMREQLTSLQRLEAMGTLAGGIAHDLNGLLQVVITAAELTAMRLSGDERTAALVQRMLTAGARARALTRKLMLLGRGEELEVGATPIGRMVDDVADLLRLAALTRPERLTIEVNHRAADCLVMADVGLVERALLNLGLNACDAMPGGGTVTIDTTAVEVPAGEVNLKAGRYGLVRVRDDGVGMSDEVLRKAGDAFFTTKEAGRGTGLGLNVAFSIAARLGGGIEIESQPGAGTTVSLYLPVAESAVMPARAPRAGALIRGSETLLLVDDHDAYRAGAEMLLQGLGYRVFVAASGREAIDIYRAHHDAIDLVLLDLVMPDLAGATVWRAMKEIRPAVKVLIVSALEAHDSLAGLREAGIHGVLPKPYRADELSAALRLALGSPAT